MRRVVPLALLASVIAFAYAWQMPAATRRGPFVAAGARDTVQRAPATESPRNANYTIAVRLDARAHLIRGHEVLTWRNISRLPTQELRFHLYYNAWKNSDTTYAREDRLVGVPVGPIREPDLAWTSVTAVRLRSADASPIDLTGARRYISPDDGDPDDQTVMSVPLPRTVAPGDTIEVAIDWTAHVPRPFDRTGVLGNYYFFGQWFPKIGVLEDTGWNCHQFHSSTEFFADYGVYDVSMTVPRNWIVGATGTERERHDNGDGTTTFRYAERDVHDFAWTTSPDFVERRQRFQASGLPPVEMRLLLQPEHVSQAERHFRATAAALKDYGQWFGAYPYGHITIVDPAWHSGTGGMEYPTLFTAGTTWLAPARVTTPESVTIHECGHQFWYALVGNNEFEDAWLDEGLNTYSTARVIAEAYGDENRVEQRLFGRFVPFVFQDVSFDRADDDGLANYRQAARIDTPSAPSFRYRPDAASALSYSKTALWLHTLENHLGWPTFRRCLATYFERWTFRHPKPADFFRTINEVSGQDLTWFFDQVYRGTAVFDYGIEALRTAPAVASGFFDRNGKPVFVRNSRAADAPRMSSLVRSTVVVRRYGDGVFPVDIEVHFANGDVARERWDGRDTWKAFTFDRPARVVSAEVDPKGVLVLDVNPSNNSLAADPETPRAEQKWTVAWMVWLQDLLLTYAWFV